MTNGEGRVIKHNKAVEPPGRPAPTGRSSASWPAGWGPATSSPSGARPKFSRSCGSPPRAGWPTTSASPTTRSRRPAGCLVSPHPRPPGHPAAVRGRPLLPPRRQGPLHRRRVAALGRAARTRSSRCGSPPADGGPLPVRQPDPPAARPGRADPAAVGRGPPLGFAGGDPVRGHLRGSVTYPALVTEAIRPDTVFVPYHWSGPVAANVLTIDALDLISKMPEFKVCACKVERGQAVDLVPEPPMPPGERPYRPETEPLAERRPPTSPQGRGPRSHDGHHAVHRPGTLDQVCQQGGPPMMGTTLYRPGPLHWLPGLRRRLPRVRLAPGKSMILWTTSTPGAPRWPCLRSACTARTRWPRAPRSARPTPSWSPPTGSSVRRPRSAASAAATASTPARSVSPSWMWPRCSSTSATSATTAPRSAWPRCAPPSARPRPSSTARSRSWRPTRPGAQAIDVFRFGDAEVRTGCAVVAPETFTGPVPGM